MAPLSFIKELNKFWINQPIDGDYAGYKNVFRMDTQYEYMRNIIIDQFVDHSDLTLTFIDLLYNYGYNAYNKGTDHIIEKDDKTFYMYF